MTLLSHSCGEVHPALVTADRFDILDGAWGSKSALEVFGYQPDWGKPATKDQTALRLLLANGGKTQ